MSTSINRFAQGKRFLRVAILLLWTIWVIYRERRRVLQARQRGDYSVRPDVAVLVKVPVAYRATALKLGVLLIKLGQFLSSRADLLPEAALEVLADLQDEVPAAPFEHVLKVIEQETGRPASELFLTIDKTASAAASLAQVHRAVLRDTGDTVAVKVQRPNIDELIRMDLNTLKFVIAIITRLSDTRGFLDLPGMYQEFSRTVHEEIDYVQEAGNAHRFRTMFENDPRVYVPKVHDRYTSRRLLVMDWVDGIKINDHVALEAAGIDRKVVARTLVEAYFHQFFVVGFFHADPHPGNLFVQTGDEHGPRVYLLDFGMVGTLNDTMQKTLKDIFSSYLSKDARALVDALSRLGFIGLDANLQAIERGVQLILDRYYGMTLRQARDMDLGEVAHEVENLLYGQPFQVPARFAFTGRAIGTLVGVSTGLAPDFNFVEVAMPYARDFLGLGESDRAAVLRQVVSQLTETGTVLLRLPRLLERVANRLETGQLEMRVTDVVFPRRRRRRRGEAAGAGNWPGALMVCGSIAGGGVLLMAQQTAGGWFCLGLAALTAVMVAIRSS